MAVKRPRQEPVSCQLCRSKKLRCDRQQPCANCCSRGVDCISQSQSARPITATPAPTTRDNDPDVQARLHRLEEAVEALRKSTLPPLSGSETEPLTPASSIDCIAGTPIQSSWPFKLELLPVAHISQAASRRGSSICLPTRDETVALFRHYSAHVNYLHHIIHAPSVLALIHDVYSRPLSQAGPAHAALILSMLAGAAYFWNEDVAMFASSADARQASSLWLDAASAILEHSRRTSSACLEDVQATIIVYYLEYNIQGCLARYHLLNTTALNMARSLSLHKIDSPTNSSLRDSLIVAEVKRRVWWHLVSSDWLLAFTPGPQEGTYFAQPRQMIVKLPRNAGDQDLEQRRQSPPSQPSTMSFFMQRIQMSEICRNIADAMTDLQLEPSLMNCETLRDLNRQFEHYLAGLPFFFKLDDRSRRESQCFNQQFPHLSTQRCLIHLCAHTRRSRLHQPWLVRGFHEPQFAFARQACLESSRTVLQVARLLEDAGNKQPVDLARLSMVVHHVSLAAVVLVVDLSSTKVRGPEEEQRKLEIVEACQMLERVKRGSALAASFLASLDEILQKHKISLPAAGAASAASAAAAAAAATSPAVGSREKQPLPDFGQQQAAVGAHGDGELDAWMQGGDVDWGFDVGVDAWDELFADLNAWPVLTTESWEFAM